MPWRPDDPPPLVAMEGVTVLRHRPGDDRLVAILTGIDLAVAAGSHWAVLGPNGAGKTTLLEICGAAAHPSRGVATVLGARLGAVDMRELRRRIGMVGAEARTWRAGMTALEVALTGAEGTIALLPHRVRPAHRARAGDLLARVGCEPLASRAFATLSRGERQRVMIARALMADPPLLLLDEPAAGLDLPGRELLLATLERLAADAPGRATILVTHHLEEIPASTTHALLLRRGRTVAAGPVAEVLRDGPVSACYGMDLRVHRLGGRVTARRVAPAPR